MTTSRGKNSDYWQGFNAESARQTAKAARSAVDAMPDLAALAREVARNLGRDQSRKQRIVERSPHIFAAMDGNEYAVASSRELETRELRELGIDPGDNDPGAILDAHHAGRQFARDQMVGSGQRRGSASDAREGGDQSFLDKYLSE